MDKLLLISLITKKGRTGFEPVLSRPQNEVSVFFTTQLYISEIGGNSGRTFKYSDTSVVDRAGPPAQNIYILSLIVILLIFYLALGFILVEPQ
jgi:hypothetical protein